MFLLRLAFKNMLRNKRRIALSLVSVVAGVAVYIIGQAFITGIKENIVRAQIDKVSGHVAIRPADYPTDTLSAPIDNLFVVDDDAAAWLDEHAGAWTKRLMFAPEAIVGPYLVRVRGIVYDPATDPTVFPRDEWHVDGAYPEGDGVLVGAGTARLLNVEAGDWITLRTRTTTGAINALEMPITGVLRTGSPIIDSTSVLLPWGVAQPLLLQGEATSHVNIRIADRDQAEAFGEEAVAAMHADVAFVTWKSETADIIRLQDLRQTIFTGLSWALLLMAATGIANTILMAAYERIREIGTLRAMGMTHSQVVQLFVIEGSLLGVLGGLLGTGIGGALMYQWSTTGIDMGALIEANQDAMASIPMSTMLYVVFDPATLLIGFSFGVFFAVVASIYPAFAASRMSPADAVRA